MNIVKESDVELKRFPERDLKMIISRNNVGAEAIAVNMVWLKPHALTKPCHAHLDEEEVI